MPSDNEWTVELRPKTLGWVLYWSLLYLWNVSGIFTAPVTFQINTVFYIIACMITVGCGWEIRKDGIPVVFNRRNLWRFR